MIQLIDAKIARAIEVRQRRGKLRSALEEQIGIQPPVVVVIEPPLAAAA